MSESAKREYLSKKCVTNAGTDGAAVDGAGGTDQRPHPYSKFSKGSLRSLETIPKERGIDVSETLIQFFRDYYLSSQAVLVMVSNQSTSSLSLSKLQQLLNVEKCVMCLIKHSYRPRCQSPNT